MQKMLPIGVLKEQPLNRLMRLELERLRMAYRRQKEAHAIWNSFNTGTVNETIYSNANTFTAFNNSAAEGSILSNNNQPVIPALFWNYNSAYGRTARIKARGVLSTTSTPTIIFQIRLGTTLGTSYLSGTSVGVSAAITTASGVTNALWELNFDLQCSAPGQGSGNTTLVGGGSVISGAGFASPYSYPLLPTTPPTGTWTCVIDNTVTQYINLSVTWSAASTSNTITLKQLIVEGLQ